MAYLGSNPLLNHVVNRTGKEHLLSLKCFLLLATDNMSLPKASHSSLTLNMNELSTFKKLTISESLWLAANAMSILFLFSSCVRLEVTMLMLSIQFCPKV